jgi:ABC-2 type transport system ATP-binding protein
MSIVEFSELRRGYRRGADVLHDVSFVVEPGEVVGLLGRNGAGKTTLMRIAMGMLEPRRGTVRVFGLDPRLEPVGVKRRVGYVSEDQILPAFLRVSQVLDLHRSLFPTWDESLAGRLGERFALPSEAKVGHLSKGQARQVALLCAVAHRPELLLLDEPAGGLDPVARREFLDTAIELLAETGSTIVFSSHHMTDVERLASRVVLLHEGHVLIDRDLDALRESHCLAIVPTGPGVSREALVRLDACLGARERPDSFHAVFDLSAEECQELLESELCVAAGRCQSLALEEMFIELVGGQADTPPPVQHRGRRP